MFTNSTGRLDGKWELAGNLTGGNYSFPRVCFCLIINIVLISRPRLANRVRIDLKRKKKIPTAYNDTRKTISTSTVHG